MKNQNDILEYEKKLLKQGYKRIAGVDEVGRGPLAGGVLAAACILDLEDDIQGINDSKKISEKKRNTLYQEITSKSKAYAFGYVNEREIDDINIYQASKLAMQRAIKALKIEPDYLLIDAMTLDLDIPQNGIIKGDTLSKSIAAASIIAKVKRDEIMEKFSHIYPGFGFEKHKGYPTKLHIEKLRQLKPCQIHRKSYKPVQDALLKQLQFDLEEEND